MNCVNSSAACGKHFRYGNRGATRKRSAVKRLEQAYRQPLRRDASRGVALIAVLALVSLLAVLAIGVVEGTRRHGQLVCNSVDTFQAQEFADSAIRLAIIELSERPVSSARSDAVSNRTRLLFGRDILVRLDYDAGRIDLNAADEYLLTAVFAGNGFSENEARKLAHRIIDWRDVDDEVQPQGAERQDYRRAGRIGGPRNGPFETVFEVLQIVGAENLDENLLDAFTVYSHSAMVRQSAAPTAVMNALRWANAQYLAGRAWVGTEESGSAALSDTSRLAGEVVRLRACARATQIETCRVAIVRFTGSRDRPTLVFAWRASMERV